MVNWAINGVVQTPINYIGLLDTFGGTGANSAIVPLGVHAFVAGVSDTFDVWTSMPNGLTDTVTNNDSNSVVLRPALPGGTYTIGGASPDYTTFAAALTDLNDNGICGPVVFNVRQGIYNEQINLGTITGSSSVNTITFQSDPLNTLNPIVQGTGTVTDNYVVRLSGSEYITFDSLDFKALGTTYSRVIDIPGGVNNITFNGCKFEGWASATTSTFQALFYQFGGLADHLTLTNNHFEGGSWGLYLRGTNTTSKSTGAVITGNTMRNVPYYQTYLWYQDSMTFDNNDIIQKPTSTSFAYGIYVYYGDNFTVRNNSLVLNTTSSNYGLYSFRAGGGGSEISNNMIVTSDRSTGTCYGLWENTGRNVNIYHNSIHVRGGGVNTRALYINGSTSTLYGNNNVVNNIAVNSVNGGNALYVNAAGVSAQYMNKMDKNIYFASGANPFNYNFTNYPTLAAYQALATADSNSYFGDPGFFGPANLRLQGTLAVDSGLNVGIMTDIDGDVRPLAPSTGYDIGADEYIPPTCPSPTAIRTAFLTADSALISWTNGIADSSWSMEWGAAGFTPGTGTVIASGNDSIGINGLSPLTCYDVWVKSICTVGDTSILYGPFNFCTPCSSYSPPYSEDFTTMAWNMPPTCWEEATGLLTTNSSLSYINSQWTSDGFGNVGFNGSAKIYIAFTGRDEWLISPTIDLGTGATPYQVEFDIAMTDAFNANPVIGGTMGPDDKFVLLISTDNGTTWSDTNILRQWDTTDIASNTGEYYSFNLTAAGYTGEVRLAFYGESTITNTRTEVFIDNFAVVQVPTCPRPTRLRQDTNNTTTSVDAMWTNGASDVSWEIEYGPIGFTPGFGTVGFSPTNPTTITGLTPSTCYDVYLRSICSAGDTSIQIGPQRMCTECGPVVDLCEDFETTDVNTLPICWEVFIASTYTGTAPAYAQVENFGGNLGPKSIQLDSRSAGLSATTIILSTPEMTALPLGTHRAEFWLDGSFTPDTTLIIGTITDPSNPATFTPYDTINDITSAYQRYRISFDSYTGTDTRIAFLYTPTANFRTINIDDFCFEKIPTCERPPSVQVLNDGIDSNYINLGWNQDTTWFSEPLKYQKEFIITYGPTGYTPGDASVIDTVYTSTTVAPAPANNFSQITGLAPLTEYCFWVKAICDNGDTSAWSGPHCGTTGCPPGVALPYSEDFTDYTSVFPLDETPQCWEEATGPIGGSIALMTESNWEPDGFGNVNFTGAARFNISAFALREGWIVSPTFDLGNDPNVARIIEFDVALTDDFNSNPAVNGFGADDTIAFVVSYDEGVTWNRSDILLQWDTSNEPSNTGDAILYIMRNTTGKVKFGFYGVSNVANEGVDFFIDNFSIRDTTWVSVDENTLDLEKFAVYPNPNTGIFTVQNKGKANTSSVKLMDMAGRLVYDSQLTFAKNGSHEIQVENLKSGVYVLLLQSEGKIEQHRIIVQ